MPISSEKEKPKKSSDRREELSRRFLESGFNGFCSEEILELMLYFSVPRDSAEKNAKKILEDIGSISDVLDADPNMLRKAGVSENTAVFFRMLTAVAGRYYSSARSGMIYDSTDKLIELFRPHFAGLNNEEFRIACFREDMSLIMTETVSRGSGARAEVSLRTLTEMILQNDCSLAAAAHNHPNASAEPSDADLRFTHNLYRLLKTMDIELVDHIIIGKGAGYSIKEEYPRLFAAEQ
ncbi:MAG: JAB domain-containing protein [Oscillospiraceae bacterium]